ncbi:MAG TPA: ABC transporter permease subunit [Pseudonocardiaceae bacterium]|nr:ABC transporter permease subunit [Pseudonocardiaceae bacterium]
MNLTIAGLTFRPLLGRRRALLLLPMPVFLIGLTVLARAESAHVDRWAPVVLGQLGLGVILPLTALIVGSSVLDPEIEDGTITHILAKPLPRSEIVLAKLAVAWAVSTVTTAVPLAVAGAIAGGGGLAAGMGVGAAVGAPAYSAIFVALSLMIRRPVAAGLLYIMLWENLLVRFVGGVKEQYATMLAHGISRSDVLPGTPLSAMAAALLSAAFIIGGTVLATSRLRSFRLTGETS